MKSVEKRLEAWIREQKQRGERPKLSPEELYKIKLAEKRKEK